MIPKVIHYCWFGGNPLPESAKKCINSWKKFLPDYEIKEWNESNFDVNSIAYTRDAYAAKKYAFVSDYARFVVLEREGGLYFDTDVEVIKPMDDIVKKGAFFGIEVDGDEKNSKMPAVAPGLCLGAEAHMPFYVQICKGFEALNFYTEDGKLNPFTMIPMVTKMLVDLGMQAHNRVQEVGVFTLYPAEYFNPLESTTGRLKVTENTRSIHWYMASWLPKQPLWLKKLKQLDHRIRK